MHTFDDFSPNHNPNTFSNFSNLKVLESILNDLSKLRLNGEGGTTFLKHTVDFLGFYNRHDIQSEDVSCGFLSLTFEGRTTNGVTHFL